jgi:hypothetical protein
LKACANGAEKASSDVPDTSSLFCVTSAGTPTRNRSFLRA